MRTRLALVVLFMLTSTAFRRRQIMRDVEQDNGSTGRYVDIGVTLKVVKADLRGTPLLDGGQPLTVLREYEFGGILDTAAVPPRIVPGPEGISRSPQVWLCSEDQERLVLHGDDEPIGKLALGGMGAGKTTAGVIWLYLRWLENLGSRLEIGITAPTETRLSLVFNELFRMWPSSWWRFNSENKIATLADGFRLRGVSTHRQSQSQGSRIQAFNWIGLLADELQDSIDEFIHMMARLRSKADGKAKRIATATAKDFPEWRTLKGTMLESGDWKHHTLLGPNSPFVHPDHWERMKRAMASREYRRLVLAEDLPPETAVYPDWSRETNLIEVPLLGWTDVTANELRGSGHDLHLLVGHDPGNSCDVSVLLKAYVPSPQLVAYGSGIYRPLWVVVGEVTTERSTTANHILDLLKVVRERWQLNLLTRDGKINLNGRQMLIRADPAGNTDNRTDKTVYTQFANHGIRIKPAAYNADNDGHGRVPREAAVELINTLICDAAGQRRLFVERLPNGAPAAPRLVAAIESSERDDSGRAEVAASKGDRYDQTHWPAGLRYALWAVERPRLQLLRKERTT